MPSKWVHVRAEDNRCAVRMAVLKARIKGHCTVEVYRGSTIPLDSEQAPLALATIKEGT